MENMKKISLLSVYFFIVCSSSIWDIQAAVTDGSYHEELVVRPLANNHVNTYFQFSSSTQYEHPNILRNKNLVPSVVIDLLDKHDIKELHISLTWGNWYYKDWGYPIVDAASGAEVWAWFHGKHLTNQQVDEQWSKLINVLSTILNISLSTMDKYNRVSPQHSFRPSFIASDRSSSTDVKRFIRYATLPREVNWIDILLHWKKLLPCNGALGFASLLHSDSMPNTKYHSLGLSLRTICRDQLNNEICTLQLTQRANLIYDLKAFEVNDNKFSLQHLFGQGLQGTCALAQTSLIYVLRSDEGAKYNISPSSSREIVTTRGGFTTSYAMYDLGLYKSVTGVFDFICLARTQEHNSNAVSSHIKLPLIYAQRYLVNMGPRKVRLTTEIINVHVDGLPIIVHEVIPWFLFIFINTLKTKTKDINEANYKEDGLDLKMLHYVPSEESQLPTHLEVGLILPPKSITCISIDGEFFKSKWLDYSSVGSHDHYIGSSTLTATLPDGLKYTAIPLEGQLFKDSFNASSSDGYVQVLHTRPLILPLPPTPDYNRPYKLFGISCLILILAFGSLEAVTIMHNVIKFFKDVAVRLSLLLVYSIKRKITKKEK